MPRLSRKLRICKWTGTLGCALVAAAFVLSGWWYLGFDGATKQNAYQFSVAWGIITLGRDSPAVWSPTGWELHGQHGSWVPSFRHDLLPSIADNYPYSYIRLGSVAPKCHRVIIPLWLPFLVLLIPTLLLWRREFIHRPGFCRHCDYDLTGNTSGRCPECGTSCRPAMDGAPPHAG